MMISITEEKSVSRERGNHQKEISLDVNNRTIVKSHHNGKDVSQS